MWPVGWLNITFVKSLNSTWLEQTTSLDKGWTRLWLKPCMLLTQNILRLLLQSADCEHWSHLQGSRMSHASDYALISPTPGIKWCWYHYNMNSQMNSTHYHCYYIVYMYSVHCTHNTTKMSNHDLSYLWIMNESPKYFAAGVYNFLWSFPQLSLFLCTVFEVLIN